MHVALQCGEANNTATALSSGPGRLFFLPPLVCVVFSSSSSFPSLASSVGVSLLFTSAQSAAGYAKSAAG